MEGQGHTGVSGKARTQTPGSTARAFDLTKWASGKAGGSQEFSSM